MSIKINRKWVGYAFISERRDNIDWGMNKYMKNCVDASLIVTQESHQHLLCCICLGFMTEPKVADCQSAVRHAFGINCIEKWTKESGKKECPLCRKVFANLQSSEEMTKQAEKYIAKCRQCQLQFPVAQINKHIVVCQKRALLLKERLNNIVTAQIAEIDKQINPHLKQIHAQIFQKYVQNWSWLHHDTRNWKWWWWCNNPWWENKSCPACNTLWHQYEVDIDALENKRIAILEELAVGEQEEKAEGTVQCVNQ